MQVSAKNVDPQKLWKASFILKTKQSTLSKEIRNIIDQYAKEYDALYEYNNRHEDEEF